MAPSPSGKAGACKASIPSSNLGGASIMFKKKLSKKYTTINGSLAELVECTGLENQRGLYLPGFESLRARHFNKLYFSFLIKL